MRRIRVETREDADQLADLQVPAGPPASGRLRYAAAMYFYNRGQISEAALEVYRILSLIDGENPGPLLALLEPDGEA